jgi:cell division protein FtsI/penicillin-binding protein 2
VPRPLARVVTTRARWLFYIFALLALFLVWRLYVVQIRDGPWLAERARLQHESSSKLDARRGTIYDRDGNVLARSLSAQSVYVSIPELRDKAEAARALGAALGIAPERVLERIDVRGGYVLVARKISHESAERVEKLNEPGVDVVREDTGVRFAPSGRLASTVLGFTGVDDNGLEGVEYYYDGLLSAKTGEEIVEGDQWGRALPFGQQHVVAPARPGYDLALTLDSYLQFSTERVLRETVAEFHAASGTALVMDPYTGEILALANAPDYDVSRYALASDAQRRDRAVSDVYEPGSTFKLITAAAALDSGKVTPADRFPARDALQVGQYTIHNADDGLPASASGSENLEDIIALSHNVGAAEVGLVMGERTMYAALERFGFNEETHAGLPGETSGIFPRLEDWSRTSLPTIAFGHGIAVTPIELARAYCAIANGGWLVRPRILDAVVGPDGKPVYRYQAELERRAISSQTAAILRGYLRAVVLRGTGASARIPGYTTAGKTGTAQVAEHGHYVAGQYVASFVGMVPADKPRYVILVKVERPRGAIYGSEVAAPAFARIAKLAMLHAGVLPTATPGPLPVKRPLSIQRPSASVNGGRASKHPL